MTDCEQILPLWRELETSGGEYVLATIVAVHGSSYRKPGARMVLARDGRRAGTVSGGCLEAEVARRAWWLTTNGAVVERYSTLEDDGDLPYGSGCGGVVHILLERRDTARRLLLMLEAAFHARAPLAIATVLDGPRIGSRAFAGEAEARSVTANEAGDAALVSWRTEVEDLAAAALERRETRTQEISIEGNTARVCAEYQTARPGLWIFGAGDDAKPLLHMARELGWFVAVADGRAHLATKARFASADEIHILPITELPAVALGRCSLRATDAAVLVTHSFEQDSRILAALLALESPPTYVGVLGPQRRTREALAETARRLGLEPGEERIDEWLERIHAPVGIDLGADTPATIALSIIAEIQKTLNRASALPLREVRGSRVSAA